MTSSGRRVYLRDEHVRLADVRCGNAGHGGWSEVRPAPVFGLVLLRRGLLRARVDGEERLWDPASVYVERRGSEQQFAHPAGADVFTELVFSQERVAAMLGGDPAVPRGLVTVTPELAVAHLLLLTRARAGADGFELGERAAVLAGTVFRLLAPVRAASGRPGTAAARTRLADDAREALAADPGLSLESLARAVGASPHHLSRTFTGVTGVTLTGYRHRLRMTAALRRLAQGERDLARLAQEVGFCDQAHMTRLLRREAGLTPGRLRDLLTSVPAAAPADVRDS